MKTPSSLNQLLQKPMDRNGFLKHSAAIALFVAGGGMIAQSVLKNFKPASSQKPVAFDGYGGSAYGGASATTAPRQVQG